MATVDAWTGQVPPITDELPLLSVLYPSQWERDWVRPPSLVRHGVLYD